MAKLFAGPTRLTKCFTSCIVPSTFQLNSTSYFNPGGKCFFCKVTSSLFNDSCKGPSSKDSGDCSKPVGNPCQPKTSDTKNVCGSAPKNPCAPKPPENIPKKISTVPKLDPCASRASRGPRGCQPAADSCQKVSKPEKTYKHAPPLEDPCSQNRQAETICPLPGKSGTTSPAPKPVADSCSRISKPETPPIDPCKSVITPPAPKPPGICKTPSIPPPREIDPCKSGTPPAPKPAIDPCSRIVKTAPTSADPCKAGTSSPAPKPLPNACSSRIGKKETPSAGPGKPGMTSPASLPPDDPCSRDCKLLRPPPCCEKPSKPEPCDDSESSSSICPPTEHEKKKAKFFKRASILGALPAVILASIIIQMRAKEEDAQPRPEYIPMEYMYRRIKRFPWGDGNHTLFHNPVKNAVPPDGYEVEDPHAVKSE